MIFTVLGASGFIGSNLVEKLKSVGYNVLAIKRDTPLPYGQNLGHVFFCIGVTGDFYSRPFDTIKAHVCLLTEILYKCSYESLLYLSSTRVYRGANSTNENATLKVCPLNPSDLYNISKLAGESCCFSINNPNVRVVRISNVVGYNPGSSNFLDSLISQALNGKVYIKSKPEASKDYIGIDDVVELLIKISLNGQHRIYNVASGKNTSNLEIADHLQRLTNCEIVWLNETEGEIFPPIDISRIKDEFNFFPKKTIKELLEETLMKYTLGGQQ